jgi:hypothetical protein
VTTLIRLDVERAASLRGAIADVRLAYAAYLSTGDPWKWLHVRAAVHLAHHMNLDSQNPEEER